jgi:1,4-dihydroxy-2-naphthoate octaprenyltransferase
MYSIVFCPLLLGSAAAWFEHGAFDAIRFAVIAVITFLLHLATSFVNDAADVETDKDNAHRSLFSGGSGVTVEGLLSPAALCVGAGLAVGGSFLLTLVLMLGLDVHWSVGLLVLWGAASGLEYSLPPLRLAYRGGGELLVFLTYSFALLLTGYCVQAGPQWGAMAWWLSLPVGFAVFAAITITQFPDRIPDLRTGKRSLVILFGQKTALRLYAGGLALSLLSAGLALLIGAVPWWPGLAALLAAPLVLGLLFPALRGDLTEARLQSVHCPGSMTLTLWMALGPAFGLLLQGWLAS